MPSFRDHYGTDAGRAFLRRQSTWLIAVAAVLLTIFEATDLDRSITRAFFDSALQAFPLTGNWWLKKALHDYARTASAACAAALIALAIAAWLAPRSLAALRSRRHELAFVAVAAVGGSLLVGVLKHFSGHACPWALIEFGGANTYAHLFGTSGASPGLEGCFPAAHPLSGYAWLCVALVLYPKLGAKIAWTWWAAVFALGTVFGVVQIMRGAHFLSHVLWTAWIVWAADVAMVALYCHATRRMRSAATAAVAPGDATDRTVLL